MVASFIVNPVAYARCDALIEQDLLDLTTGVAVPREQLLRRDAGFAEPVRPVEEQVALLLGLEFVLVPGVEAPPGARIDVGPDLPVVVGESDHGVAQAGLRDSGLDEAVLQVVLRRGLTREIVRGNPPARGVEVHLEHAGGVGIPEDEVLPDAVEASQRLVEHQAVEALDGMFPEQVLEEVLTVTAVEGLVIHKRPSHQGGRQLPAQLLYLNYLGNVQPP